MEGNAVLTQLGALALTPIHVCDCHGSALSFGTPLLPLSQHVILLVL